jgi:hypothetical protein
MKDGLYNRGAYGLPARSAEAFAGIVELHYARHAHDEHLVETLGTDLLPSSIDIQENDVVEIQVSNGTVAKGIVRYPWDDGRDLCFVLVPYKNTVNHFFVKTVWFNLVSDKHRTLRLQPFSRP